MASRLRCSRCSSPASCSMRRTCSAIPTTTSRPIRCRRRRISCPNGTSCRSTRSCARSRTSCSASPALIGSIAILFFVPWLDTSRVRSTRYRPIYKWFFWAFVVTCFVLGYLGSQPPDGVYLVLGRIFTAYYFLFFLLVMPVVGWIEKPKRTARQHHRIRARAGGGAELPRQNVRRNAARRSRWHEDAFAFRPRACRVSRHRAWRFVARRACGSTKPRTRPSPQPRRRAMRRRSNRRTGPSPVRSAPTTTLSSSAAIRSTRMSARTAIRCGSCPTAISASLADPDSRRRRSRRSPPKRR